MKAAPSDDLENLYAVLGGHIYFQTLSAAVQLDLFGLLSKHPKLTRAQIAKRLGVAEKPIRILLLGCAALGLVRKVGTGFSNTKLAQKYLVRATPGNLVSIVEWQHFINYKPMYWFYEAIKANSNVGLNELPGQESTLYERLVHQPKLERIFQDAMEAISVQANAMLANFVDFSAVEHLVDVGGGNGTNLMTLARKYPKIRGTVFDSASVCEIARRNIAQAGFADRIDAVAGNCFADPFPEGADGILFCHFFTIWSEKKNQLLLKKCYDSLPNGGRVIVFNMMQSNDESGPLSAALGSPYFLTLATGEGMLYTWREYETWMKQAGFSTVKTQVLPRDHGAIIGIKKAKRRT